MANPDAHRANRLLAALSARDLARLSRSLEIVSAEPRSVLFEAGQPVRHAYFPHLAVICMMVTMSKGSRVEVASVGSEGMVGLAPLLGRRATLHRTVVQIGGTASRIAVRELASMTAEIPALRRLLLRYVASFLAQVAQAAACNALHRLEQRCCSRLLMLHDRAQRDHFEFTQALLADALGVQRTAVTVTERGLQAAGIIRHRRGVLTILDRPRLETAACECYAIVKSLHDEVFA